MEQSLPSLTSVTSAVFFGWLVWCLIANCIRWHGPEKQRKVKPYSNLSVRGTSRHHNFTTTLFPQQLVGAPFKSFHCFRNLWHNESEIWMQRHQRQCELSYVSLPCCNYGLCCCRGLPLGTSCQLWSWVVVSNNFFSTLPPLFFASLQGGV